MCTFCHEHTMHTKMALSTLCILGLGPAASNRPCLASARVSCSAQTVGFSRAVRSATSSTTSIPIGSHALVCLIQMINTTSCCITCSRESCDGFSSYSPLARPADFQSRLRGGLDFSTIYRSSVHKMSIFQKPFFYVYTRCTHSFFVHILHTEHY